jgi:hypothetical protein
MSQIMKKAFLTFGLFSLMMVLTSFTGEGEIGGQSSPRNGGTSPVPPAYQIEIGGQSSPRNGSTADIGGQSSPRNGNTASTEIGGQSSPRNGGLSA